MPPSLDQSLLQRLEARLRAQGSLIVDWWAPGWTDEQIDELLLPLEIDLPPRDAAVPIYTQRDDVGKPRLVLASIGELVLAWIDLVGHGVWRTNPDGTWA